MNFFKTMWTNIFNSQKICKKEWEEQVFLLSSPMIICKLIKQKSIVKPIKIQSKANTLTNLSSIVTIVSIIKEIKYRKIVHWLLLISVRGIEWQLSKAEIGKNCTSSWWSMNRRNYKTNLMRSQNRFKTLEKRSTNFALKIKQYV